MVAHKITITIGDVTVEAVLDDSQPSHDILATLPQTISMVKWGEREYYGSIEGEISEIEQTELRCDDRDICYWSAGHAFAWFYDCSRDHYMPSPVRMIGKVTSDLTVFRKLPKHVQTTIARKT